MKNAKVEIRRHELRRVFEHILLPISSEFYPRNALERGVFLAEKLGSRITMLYILEEKAFDKADKISDAYRTYYEREETKNDIEREYLSAAERIISHDAKKFFENKGISFNEKVVRGEFSDAIGNEMEEGYDLILMGYESGCLLHYRILDTSRVPIWVESGSENKIILAVCSNLAPNQKIPKMSMELARLLGWELHMLYVVDTQDSVEVDKNGTRSDKKSEKELVAAGEKFLEEMGKKGIKTSLVKGTLEKETVRAAKEIGAGLVMVGREQKKSRVLGIPVKSVKQRLAEKCEYSILFIN